jgi:hypothetical protein
MTMTIGDLQASIIENLASLRSDIPVDTKMSADAAIAFYQTHALYMLAAAVTILAENVKRYDLDPH